MNASGRLISCFAVLCAGACLAGQAQDTKGPDTPALLKAAESGNASAQVALGQAYLLGQGVTKDAAQAVKWWRRAADQGDPEAQVLLGSAYRLGGIVPQDNTKAAEYWRKAAAQGSVAGQWSLAGAYRDGIGVPKDAARAGEWYRKAALQMGRAYSTGTATVSKDLVLAYAWLNIASAGPQSNVWERDLLEPQLSPDELAEAQQLSSGWKPGEVFDRKKR